MKILTMLFSLVLFSAFADGQNTDRRDRQKQQEERGYAPDPEQRERTYSAPIEREDELREEMEIDEERDRMEERARRE